MFKNMSLFAISILVAPALGLFTSTYGIGILAEENGLQSAKEVATACAAVSSSASNGCIAFDILRLLYGLSLGALVATLCLPLTYLLVAWVLGRDRTLLAQYFPWLVRIVLVILPVLLVMHGLLVWFGSWELVQLGVIPSNWKLLLILGALGLTLIISALSIVTSMRRMLEIEPLHITGIELEKHELPDLFTRVARLAARLGSRVPERIILGIEPTAYVANVPVKLRGVGDLPQAETLYLPASALRVLDDAELDALIGHELGHFRGADVDFSSRFAPSFRSLAIAAEAVATEAETEDEATMSIALIPAIGLLSFMIYTISRIVNRIGREREFAADQAALEVSNPQAIASLLVKFSALSIPWPLFRHGLVRLLHQGISRQNLSRDYLSHARQFIAATNPDDLRLALISAHTPHPLDTHPSLAQRAAAVGVDPASIVDGSLNALGGETPALAGLEALEERISQLDADYYRHPAQRTTISTDAELPAELRFSKD